MNINSGLTTAAITGSISVASSLPTPSASQSVITKSNTKSGTTCTAGTGLLLHTVTGGKTFYMTGFALPEMAAGGWDIRDSTTVAGTPKLAGNKPTAGSPGANIGGGVIATFTTGVFLDTAATGTVYWTVWGYEA